MRDWYFIVVAPTLLIIATVVGMYSQWRPDCKALNHIGLCWAAVLLWFVPECIKEDRSFSDTLDMIFRITGLFALIALIGSTCYYLLKLFFGKPPDKREE